MRPLLRPRAFGAALRMPRLAVPPVRRFCANPAKPNAAKPNAAAEAPAAKPKAAAESPAAAETKLSEPPPTAAELESSDVWKERLMLVPAIIGGALFGWIVGKGINQYRTAPADIKKEDLLKEADAGDVAKQFAAGMGFHLGQGDFEQSNEDALKYFRMAAAQDSKQLALAETKEPSDGARHPSSPGENTQQPFRLSLFLEISLTRVAGVCSG